MTHALKTIALPPTSDYLGEDPVGTRFAALKRQAFSVATLAHHLSMAAAPVLQVLRNESDDAHTIKLVDTALGIFPDTVVDLDDPEDEPTGEPSDDSPTSDLCPPPSDLPASDDPDYLAELADGLAAAEDETLHELPQEPDYGSARAALTVALFDVLRESAGEITLESIDRDMHAPRGTARNVLLGDARHAKVEDYLCWLTDLDRAAIWPPDGSMLKKPWPRAGQRRSPLPAPRSVPTTPKGPRT